jgi:hypothetical protein
MFALDSQKNKSESTSVKAAANEKRRRMKRGGVLIENVLSKRKLRDIHENKTSFVRELRRIGRRPKPNSIGSKRLSEKLSNRQRWIAKENANDENEKTHTIVIRLA